MADISKEIENLKHAVYGEEVRGSLVSLAEKNNEVSETTEAAEKKRVIAEIGRVNAEKTRVSQESARKNAETARVSAESTRASQENERNSAETTRLSAEKARGTAETERIRAEQKRQTDSAAALKECGAASDRANKAAKAAEDVVAGKGFIPAVEKGMANGVATLDGEGKVLATQIPDIAASKITQDSTHRFATDAEKAKWNTDISELTPAFTKATARANLTSKEKLKISFGKIMKWFADLKAHAFEAPVQNLTTNVAGKALDATQGKKIQDEIDALNSASIKIKDIEVRNLNINIPDGNGFFALVKTLDEVIPERKDTVGATVVSFDSVPGAVVPYLHLNQENPALYLYSNAEGALDYMVIRISYI